MTDRLDRIEQSIAELVEAQKKTDSQINGLIKVLMSFGEKVEADHTQTNQQVQALIDTANSDRAEAQRQRTAFTEAFQQLLQQLVTRLNQIWERINAA